MDELRIFGPMKLPSNCWIIRINTQKDDRLQRIYQQDRADKGTELPDDVSVMPISTLIQHGGKPQVVMATR